MGPRGHSGGMPGRATPGLYTSGQREYSTGEGAGMVPRGFGGRDLTDALRAKGTLSLDQLLQGMPAKAIKDL